MNFRLPSKETLASFFKTGLLIMSASLLLTIVLKTSPELRTASGGTLFSDSAASSAHEPVRQISTDSPRVVLTFNADLQEAEAVTELLAILQEQNASAVFFLSDAWIKKYPEEVKAISSAGHEIGYLLENTKNSSGHADRFASDATAASTMTADDMAAAADEITRLSGTRCCYFRPTSWNVQEVSSGNVQEVSFGEYGSRLLAEAENAGLSCILWNLDSQDWKDYDSEALTSFLLQNPELAPGSVLLFRCGSKYLARALPFIIQGLRDMGYEPATLSGLLRDGA